MGIDLKQPQQAAQVWPSLWSRDGFLGTNAVVLRDQYLPKLELEEGAHAPTRFDIGNIEAADRNDALELPTAVLTSREGMELSVSHRRAPTPYTLRNAEADEIHFIQSGRVRFDTDFGSIEAGTLDFVLIPRAVAYRVTPLDDKLVSLILASPQPLRLDTPAPLGMIYRGKSVRYAVIDGAQTASSGPHRLWIRSHDGITKFTCAEDPLHGSNQVEGPCPVWALNLAEINPMTYGGPGGPPGQFLTSPDTSVMSYSLSARPGGRPPVHVNADYDELVLFAAGPGAWGDIDTPGILTLVPKSVPHHGPEEAVAAGYQAWLIEVRPTLRLTAAAQAAASAMDTSTYGCID